VRPFQPLRLPDGPGSRLPLLGHGIFVALAGLSSFAADAPIAEQQLPPPASVKVDFDRDIKPIFEHTCWRCHGPERPKSRFRLDNRDSALKGGDNGIDIIPHDSGKSPLIHYVARLVADMEMPPEGKGEPLTPEQIGLLRAWIDQGVPWTLTNTPSQLAFSTTPMLRWIGVKGDAAKFREIEGMKEGPGGGVEHFSAQEQISPDEKFNVEGRVLFPDNDIQLKLALEKTDLGFVRGGFEEWRRYYDDSGGYYRPFIPPAFDPNRDLHMDIGRAWIDFGLALPHWPQIVLGYEFQFKEGSKSTLEWGAVHCNGDTKNIYPASEDIQEHVHILKLDVTHEFNDWRLEDRARVEFYENNTRHNDVLSYTLGPSPDVRVQTHEASTHIQGMNTIRLERHVTDNLYVSGGYLYSRIQGSSAFDQMTTDALGTPVAGNFWSGDITQLERDTHSFSVAALFQPWEKVALSLGLQQEWTHQEGSGNVQYDEGDPNLPQQFLLQPAIISSDYDTRIFSQQFSARTTLVPRTVVFAEGRWSEESVGQTQQLEGNEQVMGGTTFLTHTDLDNNREDYRLGFNTSPWSRLSLTSQYEDISSHTDYQNLPIIGDDYSAFIRGRKIDTGQIDTKLALRPANWLKLTLTYQLVGTHYHTTTEASASYTPGTIFAGTYRARVYGINAAVTPFRRLYLSGTFTYSDSRTATAQNGDPSIVPYRGDVYSLAANASYMLNQDTDIRVTYAFSQANYGQNNFVDGLPLGLDYVRHGLMVGLTRRLSSRLTTNIRYGFYHYSEPNTGGVAAYNAQGVFASLMVKWR